ncbi:hypothetical protein Aph01nite_78500 [Acrocarpospora phusangensis]|uniref:Uncharacterized protein n=1 Tax=Acrocarpospora phusangensis TaxID=1070424 RepID=A0A919UVM5_9ACTN|nr:hypothetical protein [Acrocarpospora phusangensis]GIH29540.1 hypothetical protein Aph01nite_78500 [Acrocarpospora phusangensis]
MLVFYEQAEPFAVRPCGGSAADPVSDEVPRPDCRAGGGWEPEPGEPEAGDAGVALDRLRTEHDRECQRMASFDHLLA